MKSKDDGTKMTVLTLCTADFKTVGRSWANVDILFYQINVTKEMRTYLSGEMMEPLFRFVDRTNTVKMNEILETGIGISSRHRTVKPT